MKYELKTVKASTLAILVLIAFVFIKGNAGQYTVFGILVACGVYNLLVTFRPSRGVSQKNDVKAATVSTKTSQKPVAKPVTPAAVTAPVAQNPVISPPPMTAQEAQTNYKLVMLRHINFRVTQKLQGAFPGATWSWCCDNPADVAAQGGIARIRTFGTGDSNYAEVRFEQNGCIGVSMLKVSELSEARVMAPAEAQKKADPDAVDLSEWYELSASSAIRATIDEVYTRGHKTLFIDEKGEVYTKEDGQHIKQGKLNFMPSKKLWADLIPCFADDDIDVSVGDDEMALTWA